MNNSQDNLMNRIHEIFHIFGFSHPKRKGGTQSIMKYPPKVVSQQDINEIANSKFLSRQQ